MQVIFNYANWLILYPQFTTTVVTEAQGQEYFYQATLYCRNNDGSAPGSPGCAPGLIPFDPTLNPPIYARGIILNLLTAHIAQLTVGCVIGGQIVPVGPLVGRISQGTQGSVSVSVELPNMPASAAYFTQTQFGLMAYQAMASYRTARYRTSPGRFFQPPPVFPIGVTEQIPYGYP